MTMKIFKGLTHAGWRFWNEYGNPCSFKNGEVCIDTKSHINQNAIYKETVEESTGAFDKNGELIFTGDIIENTFEDGNKEFLQVIFNKNICAFELVELKTREHLPLSKTDAYISEVLGNKHGVLKNDGGYLAQGLPKIDLRKKKKCKKQRDCL